MAKNKKVMNKKKGKGNINSFSDAFVSILNK